MRSTAMKPALAKYVRSGSKSVEGWLSRLGIGLIVEVAEAQRAQGVGGPVCEIGVYHGKLLILLHLLSNPTERCVGWDLFERQVENVDKSGRGNREKLLENLKRHECDLDRVLALTANSMELQAADIERHCAGRARLFSVDGGHSVEATINDLRLAADSVCEGGAIILDDFFNEAWPGVAEGACRFLSQDPLRLHPRLRLAATRSYLQTPLPATSSTSTGFCVHALPLTQNAQNFSASRC